jgi:hypothetical protein
MSQSSRTWNIKELIDFFERCGDIVPPFTDDERQLASNLSNAFHYYNCLEELSGRAPQYSQAFWAYMRGIWRVQDLRKGKRVDTPMPEDQAILDKMAEVSSRHRRSV